MPFRDEVTGGPNRPAEDISFGIPMLDRPG